MVLVGRESKPLKLSIKGSSQLTTGRLSVHEAENKIVRASKSVFKHIYYIIRMVGDLRGT
jgi:hypothetical protein